MSCAFATTIAAFTLRKLPSPGEENERDISQYYFDFSLDEIKDEREVIFKNIEEFSNILPLKSN